MDTVDPEYLQFLKLARERVVEALDFFVKAEARGAILSYPAPFESGEYEKFKRELNDKLDMLDQRIGSLES